MECKVLSRPNSENGPNISPAETQQTLETVTSSMDTPLPETTDDQADDLLDGDSGDDSDGGKISDVKDDKEGVCENGVHNEEM